MYIEIIALESPTFATKTRLSTIIIAQAHEPDFSFNICKFYFWNSSSAYLKPNFRANSGF